MEFKSTEFAGQNITWSMCCFSLLLVYLWQSSLVCFGSLSCNCRKLAFHLVQIPDFETRAITEPSSCFTVCAIQGIVGLSPSPRCIWILLLVQIFRTDSSALTTLFHFSSHVQSLYALTHWWLLTFFPSSTVVSWQEFCHTNQLYILSSSEWILMYFLTTLVQLYSDIWCSQPSVTQACDSDEIVPNICKAGNI